MSNYIMISNYMNEDKYRISFNKLAMNTFKIDFESWYQKNLYYNRYLCFSYIYEDEVVANVSINKMNLLIEGQKKKALQLGTVMTHLNHRNKGLSASLIKYIIDKYESEYDIIYLFANDSVLNFYPKFGFKKVIECAYELDTNQVNRKESLIKRLRGDDKNDYKTILRIAKDRQPVCQKFGVINDIWPLHIYCMYEYKDDIYYLEDEDAIVITRREDGCLHLYDVLSLKPIDLDSIVEKIVIPNDKKIEFHFVPEINKYAVLKTFKEREDETFVITKNTSFNEALFPMTSHT
ncbi:GNAT family N-acetyltransferase [Clostridium estertheticum]|uniref:GNAT family N-acetyltransferase n=1 Tax=Clostridium estertheticum TaxID=238834 RepID=UPI0013E94934|nr:GNAT family N-acetyltransferase [Clostridium estertheticum]MBZ9687465.1 GNAT family N-acetyltransferase [Clostridium estertheticum]